MSAFPLVLTVVAFASSAAADNAKPAPAPAASVAGAAAGAEPFILVGAGDIASCENDDDEATAKLVEGVLRGHKRAAVFTAGDNVYLKGTADEFSRCYAPTWGRFQDRTFPTVGNHEYGTHGASGYFGYFGARAGAAGQGWYSAELGEWHLVALNSNCKEVDCNAEAAWLSADLKKSTAKCTVAIWHHPLFSSGKHGSTPAVRPFWKLLEDANAELVLVGHDHIYERFAPMTSDGKIDAVRGLRSFVVGTGGKSHYTREGALVVGSEVFDDHTYGVLELTLDKDAYRWRFLSAEGGKVVDEGTGKCR